MRKGKDLPMQCMEMIKVQTAGHDPAKACEDYLAQLETKQTSSGAAKIRQYQNITVPGCHLIVLRWKQWESESSRSNLAQLFINELQRFGMVSHSTWMVPPSAKK